MFFSAGHPAASIAGFIDYAFLSFLSPFSSPGMFESRFHVLVGKPDYLRLGSRAGFQDIARAQCHAVATAWMNKSARSVHENVLGYDPSHLKEHLKHELVMSKTLTMV